MFLSLNQISKKWSEKQGVFDLSLDLVKGEGFALLGPSGCGKSTTLRMIGGFEFADSGKIFFWGKDITQLPPQAREFHTVFQRYALFPHLDVFENVAFSLRVKKIKESEIQKRVLRFLEIVEIPHLKTHRISQLSGGESQRVALARALVSEPQVLLLDEPLSALDLKLRERMQLELLSLRKKLQMSFLLVTHDQQEAMVVADRIGVMNEGRLMQVGTPQEIYHSPKNKFVASFIGTANFLNESQRHFVRGPLPASLAENWVQDWMIRPEHLKITRASQLSANTLPDNGADAQIGFDVTIKEIAFLGDAYLIRVLLPDQTEFFVKEFLVPEYTIGANVFVSWKVKDTWPLKKAQ